MTTIEILSRFELQVDDATELSSDEELALAQEVYNEVANDRPWEWLKKTATGNTSTTVSYVALPSDFKELSPNKNNESVVFVGTDYSEYKVIPFSSRREYRDTDGYCYLDIPNSRLYFTLQPTSIEAIEYDYIKRPNTLTLATSPEFNSVYHDIISYGMSAHFPTIEQADKGTSYMNENKVEYLKILSNMAVEDATIKLSY